MSHPYNTQAANMALDIVSRNIERLQHVAWELSAQFGYELPEMVVICLEYTSSLCDLINEAWPDAESVASEIRNLGQKPIYMGAIDQGDFQDFVKGTLSSSSIPDTPLEQGKVRLFVACELGFIWLQIEPKPDLKLLS